ncbi:MAG: pseudouridine synthase [Terriglobales bacterium]
MPAERLQKIIAAAGVASRRKAEELITSGRVLVNGKPITELGSKADPEQDHIRVDGKLLHAPERFSYIVLNKPKGYVTTVSDPEHRPTVMDLVKSVKGRVYPVGRLDWASEGLLLLTNDGALANSLMKAASHVAKKYVVKVAGIPDEAKLDKLRGGISIAEKGGRRVRTAPAQIKLIREGDNPWLEVTIIEGRNRQVRKMFEEVGHHVEKIRRVQYGPLSLDMPPGEFRSLTLEEVAKLKSAVSGPRSQKPLRTSVSTPEQKPSRAQKPTFTPRPAFAKKPTLGPRASSPKRPISTREFPSRQKPPSTPRPAFAKRPTLTARPESAKGSTFTQGAGANQRSTFFQKPASHQKPTFAGNSSRSRKPPAQESVSFKKSGRFQKPKRKRS